MTDRNQFFNYQNQYPYFAFLSNEPMKCAICLAPIMQNMYQACQIICNDCIYKHFCQNHPENLNPAIQAPPPTTNIFPKVHAPASLPYPQNILHNMIFICDFFYHFSGILECRSFSIEELFQSLESAEMSKLLGDIGKVLMGKVLKNLNRTETDVKISEKCMVLSMGERISEIFELETVAGVAWTRVVGEILQLKCYKEYIKETAIEKLHKNFKNTLTIEDFLAFSQDEKVGIFEILINIYLDSKDCREQISEKIEHQNNLSKLRYEKKQKIKQLDMELMACTQPNLPLEQEKIKFLQEETKLHGELLQTYYRTIPIGCDAQLNEYFFFKFESDKIFVLYPSNSPNTELGNWYNYITKDSINRLVSELVPQSKNEYKLKSSIEKIMSNGFQSKEPLNSLFENEEKITLEAIREKVLETEKKVSKYLKSSKKRWEVDVEEKKWKIRLLGTENLGELCELLLEFSEKAGSPLRQQLITKKNKNKYRKVVLKLWQNSHEAVKYWEGLVRSARSTEEVMLAALVFQKVVDSYIGKKTEEHIRHSDECYICKDGGKLIMCDNCPKVAHIKCLGIKKVPQGEWLCEECK